MNNYYFSVIEDNTVYTVCQIFFFTDLFHSQTCSPTQNSVLLYKSVAESLVSLEDLVITSECLNYSKIQYSNHRISCVG